MSESSALQAGQAVGASRFTLVRALGRGGMGEVWLAQDERLGEPVALKFLPPEIRSDVAALDDLRRETARSHKLTHANIVRIHDLHEEPGGLAFIAMEYVDGPTLSSLRVEQPGRVLAWDQLKPLVEQLCAALDYAHGGKVIHRDLKPGNIMVDSKGRLKLADFGIAATVTDSVSRISGRHATSGTLPYMSPQQVAGKRPQATDDIYALGATLYELLSAKPPFYTGEITHQVLHEPPEPLEERMAGLEVQNPIPQDVAAIVMACLAKDPAQRPQSARAVAEWIGLEVVNKPSLQSLSKEISGADRSEESAGPSEAGGAAPPPSSSRSKVLLAGVAVAALVLVALAGWYWTNRPSPRGGRPAQRTVGLPEPGSSGAAGEPASPPATVTQDLPTPPEPTPQTREFLYKQTPQGALKMYLHYPLGWRASDHRPAAVFFFSGAWRSGSVDEFVVQAEYFAVRGMVTACPDYRVLSRHKTTPDRSVEDAKSAIRWLRSNASQLGIDPAQIVAAGGSAGGQLAAGTALLPGFNDSRDDQRVSCKPNALVLYNPDFGLPEKEVKNAEGKNIGPDFWPTPFLTRQAPPTVIFFGAEDRLLAPGRKYCQQAKQLGTRAELFTAGGQRHGFFHQSPWQELTLIETDRFLTSLAYLHGEPKAQPPVGTKATLQRDL